MGSKLKDSELWGQGRPGCAKKRTSGQQTKLSLVHKRGRGKLKKAASVMIVGAEDSPTIAKAVNIDRQVRLRKLLRVTAWVLRLVENMKPGGTKGKDELSRHELLVAEKEWVKAAQLDLKCYLNRS